MNAFDQLYAESYVERRVGDGTYVSRYLPDDLLRTRTQLVAKKSDIGDRPALSHWGSTVVSMPVSPGYYRGRPRPFRTSTPALDQFPYKVWGRLLARRWAGSGPSMLPYGDSAGHLALRKAIADYLNTARGVNCVAEQVLICSGSQHALELLVKLLVNPGDAVWMEDPGFLGARAAFASVGGKIVPVPVDDEGVNVAAGVARHPRPSLIYVTPSHQYPLGRTLTLSRRLALLKLASEAGAWIIEDDYDSEFRYTGRPLAALQGLDEEQRVIYVGTLSKVLFPSLRIGYIVAPSSLFDAVLSARTLAGHQCPILEQAVLADFISEGHFARHLRRMRALYAERQQALIKAVAEEMDGLLDIQPNEAGMHVIGWLPEGMNDQAAAKAAFAAGVEVTALSAYSIQPPLRGALRLGFTGYSPRQIRQGVKRLAPILRVESSNSVS